MQVEIVKMTNGLGEVTFQAYSLDKDGSRLGTICKTQSLKDAEDIVQRIKLSGEVVEESVKIYEA